MWEPPNLQMAIANALRKAPSPTLAQATPAPQMGGRPIDQSRPMIINPDGTFSTERTITVEADGTHFVIPTIVNGKQHSENEAINLWQQGQNKEVGAFPTAQEADAYAKQRTKDIGAVRKR